MGSAKQLVVKPISSKDAARIICALHYSGKSVKNSQIHLGVFLNGRCGGALQLGPSLDKRKTIGLVSGTGWNQFIELNRMAFADWLPRNGESRVLGYTMRWLRKTYPHLKWVLSYADATQCGDGTIYRAAGFVLTDVRKNTDLLRRPDGTVVHSVAAKTGRDRMKLYAKTRGASRVVQEGSKLQGFQLRYIYFLDPSWRSRLAVPEVPFSAIAEKGARMYRGRRVEGDTGDAAAYPAAEGGSTPTSTLQREGDA